MENKYYTPSIKEFHVGFEYERMNGDRWEKDELNERDMYASPTNDGEENEFEEISIGIRSVRVKYLDKEDFDSLGFKTDIQKDGRIIAAKPKLIGNVETGHWIIKYKPDTLKIQIESISVYNDTIYWLQNVTIKNKSELKVLLKQLGIDG